ncbi:SDR family oxidoreductase [Halorientalis pallida]|uniref:SDR family oxidoreductase n=1 Tax=Halorientalis pallida TaxID=2479928 RepID=A0A498KRI1_9EURY|nr:SDR family oxidoreductase [Halorientalis pallida]RXK46963.1 SDR family oxidoreductase [Halorientalis pallida]
MSETIWELFDMEGRVAIVTGGYGQLGSQMSDALAEAGAHVVVAARTYERCAEKARELSEKHNEAMAVEVDVTDEDDVQEMVDDVVERFGTIDVLVNNAYDAYGYGTDFEDLTLEDWERTFEGVVTQSFLCTQAALPAIRDGDHGTIINIGSHYGVVAPDHRIYGETDMNNPPTYGAAKAGLIQFTRWLASYLADEGIRVNSISPGGFYREEMEESEEIREVFLPEYRHRTPLDRMGDETDMKGLIAYLASDAGKWMTGQNIVLAGGWTVW